MLICFYLYLNISWFSCCMGRVVVVYLLEDHVSAGISSMFQPNLINLPKLKNAKAEIQFDTKVSYLYYLSFKITIDWLDCLVSEIYSFVQSVYSMTQMPGKHRTIIERTSVEAKAKSKHKTQPFSSIMMMWLSSVLAIYVYTSKFRKCPYNFKRI